MSLKLGAESFGHFGERGVTSDVPEGVSPDVTSLGIFAQYHQCE